MQGPSPLSHSSSAELRYNQWFCTMQSPLTIQRGCGVDPDLETGSGSRGKEKKKGRNSILKKIIFIIEKKKLYPQHFLYYAS
jgi:hypothetical protein